MNEIYLTGRDGADGLFDKGFMKTKVQRFTEGKTVHNAIQVELDSSIEEERSVR